SALVAGGGDGGGPRIRRVSGATVGQPWPAERRLFLSVGAERQFLQALRRGRAGSSQRGTLPTTRGRAGGGRRGRASRLAEGPGEGGVGRFVGGVGRTGPGGASTAVVADQTQGLRPCRVVRHGGSAEADLEPGRRRAGQVGPGGRRRAAHP